MDNNHRCAVSTAVRARILSHVRELPKQFLTSRSVATHSARGVIRHK
jgi:hypothetical protein